MRFQRGETSEKRLLWVLLSTLDELQGSGGGFYVFVGGITPTPLGEDKSTATVGMCQALGALLEKKLEHHNSKDQPLELKGVQLVLVTVSQSEKALFNRLCPLNKEGKRSFSDIMFRRLKKLGISKTKPEELTPEEVKRFARLDIDPNSITWRRVMDVNDRFLWEITIGQGQEE
ncbi:hypothetical protein SLEP1_g31672 [Rubroshorea leprosula]|uniref:Uncharacterized protein n=1 Tax=Rubroshorea leprosula TaxID=152421 RepID=A0AAV5K8I7_9ROSI|nr:hypothetical protein SLEP1_g31672 [Rubroshorea leprosula]